MDCRELSYARAHTRKYTHARTTGIRNGAGGVELQDRQLRRTDVADQSVGPVDDLAVQDLRPADDERRNRLGVQTHRARDAGRGGRVVSEKPGNGVGNAQHPQGQPVRGRLEAEIRMDVEK